MDATAKIMTVPPTYRQERIHTMQANSPFKSPHLVASGVSRIIIPWGIAV
jgi:hypothetical protein